jgi:hypothetical protein
MTILLGPIGAEAAPSRLACRGPETFRLLAIDIGPRRGRRGRFHRCREISAALAAQACQFVLSGLAVGVRESPL